MNIHNSWGMNVHDPLWKFCVDLDSLKEAVHLHQLFGRLRRCHGAATRTSPSHYSLAEAAGGPCTRSTSQLLESNYT